MKPAKFERLRDRSKCSSWKGYRISKVNLPLDSPFGTEKNLDRIRIIKGSN